MTLSLQLDGRVVWWGTSDLVEWKACDADRQSVKSDADCTCMVGSLASENVCLELLLERDGGEDVVINNMTLTCLSATRP